MMRVQNILAKENILFVMGIFSKPNVMYSFKVNVSCFNFTSPRQHLFDG